MKKSKTITLTLITPFALTLINSGCSSSEDYPPPPQDLRFNSFNECLEYYTHEQCDELMSKAKPLFDHLSECENVAGSNKCQAINIQGQNYWMPLLAGAAMGYLAGRLQENMAQRCLDRNNNGICDDRENTAANRITINSSIGDFRRDAPSNANDTTSSQKPAPRAWMVPEQASKAYIPKKSFSSSVYTNLARSAGSSSRNLIGSIGHSSSG
jgi:uncharacterized protein YgiB involved in biofilm formation